MKTVHKSVLIWYSAAEMFALVTDVARYPQFLPWCDQASVHDETPEGM
ncbi:MAG: ubiquinone-binding protein, partial [Polaromonas sp.]|nr:ubiquinone-binding protein [Polaromonas sp.]